METPRPWPAQLRNTAVDYLDVVGVAVLEKEHLRVNVIYAIQDEIGIPL
jgi:hypothetical protein